MTTRIRIEEVQFPKIINHPNLGTKKMDMGIEGPKGGKHNRTSIESLLGLCRYSRCVDVYVYGSIMTLS